MWCRGSAIRVLTPRGRPPLSLCSPVAAAAPAAPRSNTSQRTYMDVHRRPSHSGMFQREVKLAGGGKGAASASAAGEQQPPPLPPSDEAGWSLYGLLLRRGALAAGLIYLVTEYVADITLCEGPSMSPTLQPAGEIVLLDKYTIRRYGVSDGCRGLERLRRALERQERFVTAAAAKPDHDEEFWHAPRISVSDLAPPTWQDVHQLLSTPLSVGDVVVVEHPSRRGTVCKRVVGLPGDTVLRPRAGLLVLPDGHVWLEGDNPANSADSRSYGAVPLALVQGRVLFRVWPLRGSALLQRGAPPRQQATGYTILPAGYEGQHIIKHRGETTSSDDK